VAAEQGTPHFTGDMGDRNRQGPGWTAAGGLARSTPGRKHDNTEGSLYRRPRVRQEPELRARGRATTAWRGVPDTSSGWPNYGLLCRGRQRMQDTGAKPRPCVLGEE
jgi:hypothetical protein